MSKQIEIEEWDVDVVSEQESQRLSIDHIRRMYNNLWNRISFVESRVDASDKLREQVVWQEFEATAPKQTGLIATTDARLPTRYDEKSFPFISLPLVEGLFFLRRAYRRVASYIVSPDPSIEGTRKATREAVEERNLLNIIRLQREIHKVQRALSESIRKNHVMMCKWVGYQSNGDIILAHALKSHFEKAGYTGVSVSISSGSVWLHINLDQ